MSFVILCMVLLPQCLIFLLFLLVCDDTCHTIAKNWVPTSSPLFPIVTCGGYHRWLVGWLVGSLARWFVSSCSIVVLKAELQSKVQIGSSRV